MAPTQRHRRVCGSGPQAEARQGRPPRLSFPEPPPSAGAYLLRPAAGRRRGGGAGAARAAGRVRHPGPGRVAGRPGLPHRPPRLPLQRR